jgi:hypothetical protein
MDRGSSRILAECTSKESDWRDRSVAYVVMLSFGGQIKVKLITEN